MTQSFILMALGISIGYVITVWLQRFRGTSVPIIGPITDMHSVGHASSSSGGGKVGMSVNIGAIDKLVRESGADVVMFVNDNGDLIVVDAETGEEVLEFDDAKHECHGAEIRLDEQGEPVLYDLLVEEKGQPMVLHEKRHDNPYRIPCPNPVSGRCLDARIIYFWRYKGSRCTVLWTGGKARFRCGS